MTTPAFESALARLYTDAVLRERFLKAAEQVVGEFGLSPDEATQLIAIDRVGLTLAAQTFDWKRAKHRKSWSPLRFFGKVAWFGNGLP